jgi:hypothetical protein
MPIDYKKYPSNWKTEIRPSILERANFCCEFCGVNHHAVGYRNERGSFIGIAGNLHNDFAGQGIDYDTKNILSYSLAKEFRNMHNEDSFEKHIIIVLTIAHLDHDITNNCSSNLKALCQSCHLSYDAEYHKKNARQTLKTKKGLLEFAF